MAALSEKDLAIMIGDNYAADAAALHEKFLKKLEPKPPSSLTGNSMPHCDLGYYPAGNICKPAPPGFFAGPSATYPTACPVGKTSSYGARGRSECY